MNTLAMCHYSALPVHCSLT